MRRDVKIILIGAVLIGAAAVSAVKRGGRGEGGKCSGGGACCPLVGPLEAKTVPATTNRSSSRATAQQIVAYYFHGTVRCEICLLIEKLARAVVEQEFGAELSMNRLVFTPVNYELPENSHFLTDYQLRCPSLVLVERRGDKEGSWKVLAETWQLVHEPMRLNAYVESEVRNFLDGAKQPASTNRFGLSPAKEDH